MITDALLVKGIFFEVMLAITNIKRYYETADKVKRLEDGMKADYKNWMPKGMVLGSLAATVVFCVIIAIVGIDSIIGIVLLVISILCAIMTLWMFLMYRAFSYNGTRQMSKQIIDGVSSYVVIPDGGKCLDVGCGSGALSNAVAKKNPCAQAFRRLRQTIMRVNLGLQ